MLDFSMCLMFSTETYDTTFSYFCLRSGKWVAAYWEIAAHSAYDMFSKYKYLIVNLVFPTSVVGVEVSFWLPLFLIIAYLYFFVYALVI